MKRTMRRIYSIHYRMHCGEAVKHIDIIASNKWDAYTRATYEEIPKIEDGIPYSAWVDSYTTHAGRDVRIKNAFEGNPVGDC